MAHADGEHQERHQHRVGVQFVAQQGQQAQLPDHRHQRAEHHQHGTAHTARVSVEHHRGDQDGDSEEQQDLLQAFDQVTHFLGEAGDVDIDAVALVLRPQCLQVIGQHPVVQRLAIRRARHQRHIDDAGVLVEGYQLANLVGQLHVAPQLAQRCRAAIVFIRNHRAAVQALFGHRYPTGSRRPQRFHVGTVDTRQQVDLVAQCLQGTQVVGVVDITVAVGDGDTHRIADPGQLLLVVQVVGDVGVPGGDHLLEAGIELQAGRLPAEQHGGQQAQQQHPVAVIEQGAFDQRSGARIEGIGRG
ncbi:hypothetical protein D9M71_491520 [compost metagenome]